MVTLQQTAKTHKDVQDAVDTTTSKTVIKMHLVENQFAVKNTALNITAVKKSKSTGTCCVICRDSQKSTRKQRQKRARKCDAQIQIRKNLKTMLKSHFSKLERKIEQITKSTNGQLRIDLRSQIDQLNTN